MRAHSRSIAVSMTACRPTAGRPTIWTSSGHRPVAIPLLSFIARTDIYCSLMLGSDGMVIASSVFYTASYATCLRFVQRCPFSRCWSCWSSDDKHSSFRTRLAWSISTGARVLVLAGALRVRSRVAIFCSLAAAFSTAFVPATCSEACCLRATRGACSCRLHTHIHTRCHVLAD